MQSTPIFRPPRNPLLLGSSWVIVAVGALQTLLGAIQFALRLLDPTSPEPVLIVLHLALTVLGICMAGAGLLIRYIHLTAETRLTPDGLVHREIRPKLFPWHTIAAIDTVHRGRYRRVRVTLLSGRRTILVAPLTVISESDSEFTREVQAIREWWERYRRATHGDFLAS